MKISISFMLQHQHSMHYENMKQAVNAGKHILCEKAITVNVAQLEEVLELAEEKGVVVREAMTISHMLYIRN